jgi:hypothetical protein
MRCLPESQDTLSFWWYASHGHWSTSRTPTWVWADPQCNLLTFVSFTYVLLSVPTYLHRFLILCPDCDPICVFGLLVLLRFQVHVCPFRRPTLKLTSLHATWCNVQARERTVLPRLNHVFRWKAMHWHARLINNAHERLLEHMWRSDCPTDLLKRTLGSQLTFWYTIGKGQRSISLL